MALDLRLTLSQRLVMTPQLQQAIKLLQLSRMELEQAVREELEVNPALEELPEGGNAEADPGAEPPGEPAEPAPAQQSADSHTDAASEASADVRDDSSLIDRVDWDYFFGEGANYEGGGVRDAEEEDGRPYYENTLTRGESLSDHLEEQVNLSSLPPGLREAALWLIGNIDENGYLQATTEEASGALGLPPEEVERVVAFLQTLDPPGIGGRDLRECLLIQARRRCAEIALAQRAAKDHYPLLRKDDPAALAAALGVAEETAEQAAERVRSLEPDLDGRRSTRERLEERLRLEAAEYGLAEAILESHFDLFSKGDVAGIARRAKADREAVKAAFRRIVTLWPKPGRAYSSEDAQQIVPDAYVSRVGDEWVVTLNDDGQPRLRLSGYYRRLLRDGEALGKEDREFLRQKINSALWFIKSIDQRQRTIYKVVESIMRFQRDFLERGPKHLRPLTLRDVAEVIEMHESTVSRVTSGKYVYTPHGIFELKFFFNSGLKRDGGEETIASKSVKEKIREIIVAEGGDGKPLSDQELMRLLRNQGIRIARRTVTKYRGQLGLLAASKRRKIV